MKIKNSSLKGTEKQRERIELIEQTSTRSNLQREGSTCVTTMYTLSIKSLIAVTYLYDEKQEVKNVGEVVIGFVQEHVPNIPLLFQVQLGKLYRKV